MAKVCPNCKKNLSDNAVYCDACGTLWKKPEMEDYIFCSNCGEKLHTGDVYCSSCGNKVTQRKSSSETLSSGKKASNTTSIGDTVGESVVETSIELFRISRYFARLMPMDVYVDNVKIGSVSNGAYKRFNITPGSHTLQTKISWSFLESDTLQFNISKGQCLQFDCDHKVGNIEILTNFWLVKRLFSNDKPLTIKYHR